MRYKYLSISGKEIQTSTHKTKEQLIDSFEENGIVISVTPIVEIENTPYWNENTEYGVFTKEEWIKNVCPCLMKVYY